MIEGEPPKPAKNKGGRPPGKQTKETLARIRSAKKGLALAVESGVMPLEVILRRMRNPSSVAKASFDAAVAAAPYVHPKLNAVAFRDTSPKAGEIDLSDCTPEELAVLRRVVGRGALAALPAPVVREVVEGVIEDDDDKKTC